MRKVFTKVFTKVHYTGTMSSNGFKKTRLYIENEIINTMTTALRQRESANAWEQFCQWIASTENRLYVGWFGVIMI
ncbi:photosystem I reaction center subunit IX, partial [Prochlorothrix hollandica PCC 9006 = CALU 1027]